MMVERNATVGGGMRSAELTLPGFVHDVWFGGASAGGVVGIFPGVAAGAVRARVGAPGALPGAPVGRWEGGGAGAGPGGDDGGVGGGRGAWHDVLGWVAEHGNAVFDELLGPLSLPPKHPLLLARFGLKALWPAKAVAEHFFATAEGRALFAGHAAHSILPLEKTGTAAVGILLGSGAHHAGWPVAKGGSGSIAAALKGYFEALGG